MKRLALLLVAVLASSASAQPDAQPAPPKDPLAQYFSALEAMKLIDVESGSLETLRHELAVGEGLLRDGAFMPAAVALYAIVDSPRYADSAFHDSVEFQNAEYDLAVALARAGSYGAAMDGIEAVLRRGPGAPYWGPAHRRAVDIALETRDHAGILARLEAIKSADPIPASAAGERAYLRGRAAYDQHKLADAEGELVTISKKSRLYSSAVYLRGVIRARRGEYKASAEAMCEVAGTPDNDKFTFAVDERYFTIKDLARLGLGRIAHEQGEYDDAYYHFFQIPDDSQYLPDALFEAAWSMYQKRELATSRDLVAELLKEFPTSPNWPEASLLAGYVELADCKFDDSQKWYDNLVLRLQPIVDELDKARKDPELRHELFESALTRYREVKQDGTELGKKPGTTVATTPRDEVLSLLRLDSAVLAPVRCGDRRARAREQRGHGDDELAGAGEAHDPDVGRRGGRRRQRRAAAKKRRRRARPRFRAPRRAGLRAASGPRARAARRHAAAGRCRRRRQAPRRAREEDHGRARAHGDRRRSRGRRGHHVDAAVAATAAHVRHRRRAPAREGRARFVRAPRGRRRQAVASVD